jgi:DNA-binding NarL/FixJ family response regulator
MSLRCLIVDDSPSFRDVMRALLDAQGIDVVGGAGSGAEALRQIAELRPDVALIDIDLGGEDGLALARSVYDGVVDAFPKVILISTHDESEFADLIEATSAAGFLSKTELTAATIRRTLEDARDGG